MSFSAVIFDLDGTLLDTLNDLADSFNAALRKQGFPTHPVDAYRYFVGQGTKYLIEQALPPDRLDQATMAKMGDIYGEEYARRWDKSKPYPGIAAMLDGLVQRQIRLAVLSNKADDFTHQCVSTLLSKWRFEVVRGVSAQTPRKPDPTGALAVAKTMDLAPADFLYLGDTNTDMQTANAAGMYAVGALWGFRDRAELEATGAKVVLDRPEELLRLVR